MKLKTNVKAGEEQSSIYDDPSWAGDPEINWTGD
jgi:hypothetical protein